MAEVNIQDLSISSKTNIIEEFRKNEATADSKQVQQKCFAAFDKDNDGYLNRKEFEEFLGAVFQKNGQPYKLSETLVTNILKLLDENQDGKIDKEEFKIVWDHWLNQVLFPVSALIIVDVQNDFISGSLAIQNCPAKQDGEVVVGVINKLLKNVNFSMVIYSSDWHPANHISFIENVRKRKIHKSSKVTADKAKLQDMIVFEGPPVMEQKMWPQHCVQNTWGAELHKDLMRIESAVYINKGTNPDIDSYSAFWDNKKMAKTNLIDQLTSKKVTDLYVCGLAFDVCVGSTAFHSTEYGLRTILLEDASRGVSVPDIDAMREHLKRHDVVIAKSTEVADIVAGNDRRPEMGYKAALSVAMAIKLVKENEKK